MDAAMRVWMNGVYTYMEGVQIGETMKAMGIGRVLKIKANPLIKVGDLVMGMLGWQLYSKMPLA